MSDRGGWIPPAGYELVRLLGAGGMGEVFLVRDRTGRPVAIKVMHEAFVRDTGFRARFAREVAAARRVSGPWTAEVVDADPDAPRPWLATEYVDGPSLAAAVAEHGPFPEATVRALGARLAQALSAIHGAGLVHRDLTPGNVLLAPDGPRVVDFGVVRVLDGTKLTLTGHAVGTPAYMAPEQLGDGPAGPAADVFALGSLLCFAATGRGPFDDRSPVATLRRVLTGHADLSAVPAGLRESVAPCLRVQPDERPSAPRLAAALDGDDDRTTGRPWVPLATVVHAHRQRTLVPPPPAAPAEPTPGRPRRRRAVLVGALGLVAVLVAGGVVAAVTVGAGSGSTPTPAGTTPVIPAGWLPETPTSTPTPSVVLPEPFDGATPTIPGWTSTGSARYGLAYDVPPTWTTEVPDRLVKADVDRPGDSGLLRAGARFRPGYCGGILERAVVGVSESPIARPSEAARDAARDWAGSYSSTKALPVRFRDVTSSPITLRGVTGERARASIDVPVDDRCDPVRATVHVVAVPAAAGGTVTWVMLVGEGIGETPPASDIDRMISTIRPTGQACGSGNRPSGRWC